MTDEEELGKAYFTYVNRNWPAPRIEWEYLSSGAQRLWIMRFKDIMKFDD